MKRVIEDVNQWASRGFLVNSQGCMRIIGRPKSHFGCGAMVRIRFLWFFIHDVIVIVIFAGTVVIFCWHLQRHTLFLVGGFWVLSSHMNILDLFPSTLRTIFEFILNMKYVVTKIFALLDFLWYIERTFPKILLILRKLSHPQAFRGTP